MRGHRGVPVIDLFAGPGGLGEGFTSLRRHDEQPCFDVRLSIEKDEHAHSTLLLRAFYRQFERRRPGLYYDVLRGGATREHLFSRFPDQAEEAAKVAWKATLGVVDPSQVSSRITAALHGAREWVLIGGPPCQAYSVAGRSRNKGVRGYSSALDERQYLYQEYLGIISDHWPAIFVMENVPGLLSATVNRQKVFELMVRDLQSPSQFAHSRPRRARTHRYTVIPLTGWTKPRGGGVDDFVVRAELHGIPQARHRVILLGVRDDIDKSILYPQALLPISAEIPARDVLDDLPKVRSALSMNLDSPQTWLQTLKGIGSAAWLRFLGGDGHAELGTLIRETVSRLHLPRNGRGKEFLEGDFITRYRPDWFHDPRLEGICNYSSREHMPEDLHRYLYAACYAKLHGVSPKLRDFPTALLPDHANVELAINGHGYFGDRFRVQTYGRPATTITSHIAKDGHGFIHPDQFQCRSLTVREAARLQTFPDNYAFSGSRTQQYVQVGNAVPPLLAQSIAKAAWRIIEGNGLMD